MTRRARKNHNALAENASKVKVRVRAPADRPGEVTDEVKQETGTNDVEPRGLRRADSAPAVTIQPDDLAAAVVGVLAEVGGFGHPVTVEDCEQVRDMIRTEVAKLGASTSSIDVWHTHSSVRIQVVAGGSTVRRDVDVQM